MSSNSGSIMAAAHIDASRFAAGPIDMKNIGEAEARKLMSAEHKALGYRPPPGSLVAEAQSVAAKRPQAGGAGLNLQLLEKAAADDAVRIKEQRGDVPVDRLGEAEARMLVSEEHRALGYRPPAGSLAAQAQAAAAQHPEGEVRLPAHQLQRAALEDAARIEGGSLQSEIDLNAIGQAEARKLMSEEHRALGYRPPPGSLAAEAQSAAAKHPESSAGVDVGTLTKAAVEDAKAIEAARLAASSETTSTAVEINPLTMTVEEARALQSEEQKTLGYRPPADSLAAAVQSVVDTRADVPVTKELAAEIQSEECQASGRPPESGSMAAAAQTLADKNENDGGMRTFGDAGL